jgi:hypothetical protein
MSVDLPLAVSPPDCILRELSPTIMMLAPAAEAL